MCWTIRMNCLLPPSIMSTGNEGRRGSTQTKKRFSELSERQKNRRVEELSASEVDKLLLASAKAAKMSNKVDLEYVLRLLYKDHEEATKIRNLLKIDNSKIEHKKMTPLRGLTYLLDNKLTSAQYTNTRLISKEYGLSIFPSYNKILQVKQQCRPSIKCNVNDVSATLPLQALLSHTANRLLLLQEPIFTSFKDKNIRDLKIKLQLKWGSDGSADHSQYNQKYINVESTVNSDANFFATTLVPLRMTTEDARKMVIWNNATPQSSRWCRPLRLHFAKETEEFTMKEINIVRAEIAALNPFIATISGIRITVVFELNLTMIDGKTRATITNTKSKQRCTVCKATPKEFNNLANMEIRFKPKEGTLKFGISVLHLWIRCFEWLLHLSYRIKIEKWQLRGPLLQAQAKKRKILLQKRFQKKMGIRVDYPSTGGCGNSNNGNVCRKAFSDPELLSKILGVDEGLIKKHPSTQPLYIHEIYCLLMISQSEHLRKMLPSLAINFIDNIANLMQEKIAGKITSRMYLTERSTRQIHLLRVLVSGRDKTPGIENQFQAKF